MENKHRTRTRGPAVAVLLTLFLLSGCGGGDGGDDTSGTSGTTGTSGGSSTGTPGSTTSGTSTSGSGTSGTSSGSDGIGDDTYGTTGGGIDSPEPADEPVGNCASYTLPASDQTPKSFTDGTRSIELRRGYARWEQVVEATSDDGQYSGEYSLMSGEASFYGGRITVSIEYEMVTGFDGTVSTEPVQKAHVCGWSEG
ncbi:hypothetical protein AB0F07_29790 [Streptomyces fructofermentans]|uniref:hypothetical protein n=1 Tax=Streptomyces fructofermentans TaxID=152141 RepID=UPI003410E8C5